MSPEMRIEAATARSTRQVPRWAWWVLAGLTVVGVVAWGWQWLTAVGLASVIVAFLPCAVMCGAGLCMARRGRGAGNSCHGAGKSPTASEASVPTPPSEK